MSGVLIMWRTLSILNTLEAFYIVSDEINFKRLFAAVEGKIMKAINVNNCNKLRLIDK